MAIFAYENIKKGNKIRRGKATLQTKILKFSTKSISSYETTICLLLVFVLLLLEIPTKSAEGRGEGVCVDCFFLNAGS